eukprot:g5125.t1
MFFDHGRIVSARAERWLGGPLGISLLYLLLTAAAVYTVLTYFEDYVFSASSLLLTFLYVVVAVKITAILTFYVLRAVLVLAFGRPKSETAFGGTNATPGWTNKHVFITGGSEGTGLEIAKILIDERHAAKTVTLFSRSESKLHAAKTLLEGIMEKSSTRKRPLAQHQQSLIAATEIRTVSGDATSLESLQKAIGSRYKNSSTYPDVVVCAAGMSIPKYFEELTSDDFEKQMRVNYFGVVNTARAFLGQSSSQSFGTTEVVHQGTTEKKGGGDGDVGQHGHTPKTSSAPHRHFVVISSMAANIPFIGYAAYSPTKAANRAFCDVLRNEFADDPNTHIHISFPPDMDTPGFERENETKPIECKKVFPEAFNEVFQPEDVARMIVEGIEQGDYHIWSPDFFGNFLVSRAWGHHPRKWVLVEMVLAPLFVLVHELMVFMVDRCVAKYGHHQGGLEGEAGGGGGKKKSSEALVSANNEASGEVSSGQSRKKTM